MRFRDLIADIMHEFLHYSTIVCGGVEIGLLCHFAIVDRTTDVHLLWMLLGLKAVEMEKFLLMTFKLLNVILRIWQDCWTSFLYHSLQAISLPFMVIRF